MSFVVATFYHFFDFPGFAGARAPLLAELKRLDIKGTVLLAPEGINGTLSGRRETIDKALAYLSRHVTGAPLEHKESLHDRQPFARTKVRLKKEVIGLGEHVPPQQAENPRTGVHLDAQAWNQLLDDPETVLLDSRNSYEVHLGTFAGAIDPDIRTFKQLPDYVRSHLDPAKHKKIATFCTGGIRCEKFSAWLLDQGFEQVYQLKGGILKYLEDMPQQHSKWQGECYVFDERVAVGHGLAPSQTASMCRACGHALTPDDRARPEYREGESCPHCHQARL